MKRSMSCIALLLSLGAHAEPMPALLPLMAEDIPAQCGCQFGHKRDVPLVFWSWEDNKQHAVIREAGGLRQLRLRSEKYLPAQHEPPRAGDRMTLQFAWGPWSIQTASEATQTCSPRAKICKGTSYRSRLLLQWEARQRKEINGWAFCGCP